MLRGVYAHHLKVVYQDGPPVISRLESSKGGGIDLSTLDPIRRTKIQIIAYEHEKNENLLSEAGPDSDFGYFYKRAIKSTNADLPTEVLDPTHNQ